LDGQKIQTDQDLKMMRNGDRIMIAIRPERVSFAEEGQKKANVLTGTIENITFLGSIVRVQVMVGANLFYMDTFNNPHLTLPKIKDKAEITCSAEAVLAMNKKAEA
jgi:putative spermidine/putrescine transport system ATP-binding protein